MSKLGTDIIGDIIDVDPKQRIQGNGDVSVQNSETIVWREMEHISFEWRQGSDDIHLLCQSLVWNWYLKPMTGLYGYHWVEPPFCRREIKPGYSRWNGWGVRRGLSSKPLNLVYCRCQDFKLIKETRDWVYAVVQSTLAERTIDTGNELVKSCTLLNSMSCWWLFWGHTCTHTTSDKETFVIIRL